jgi:hypothetical protein
MTACRGHDEPTADRGDLAARRLQIEYFTLARARAGLLVFAFVGGVLGVLGAIPECRVGCGC